MTAMDSKSIIKKTVVQIGKETEDVSLPEANKILGIKEKIEAIHIVVNFIFLTFSQINRLIGRGYQFLIYQ